MYLKLQISYVDPVTSTPLPDGVLEIDDYHLLLANNTHDLRVAVYSSEEACESPAHPLSLVTASLNAAEIAQLKPTLLEALYTILSQRPEFAGSEVIAEDDD